jgi:hypothetical protein
MIIYSGKIFFFDRYNGMGQVLAEDGVTTYNFYYDAIEELDQTEEAFWQGCAYLNDDNKKILLKYMTGLKVGFTLYQNLYMEQIDRIWLI